MLRGDRTIANDCQIKWFEILSENIQGQLNYKLEFHARASKLSLSFLVLPNQVRERWLSQQTSLHKHTKLLSRRTLQHQWE